jgi:hypothetical protein
MSLIDRVHAVQRRCPQDFVPLTIGNEAVGFPTAVLADQLVDELPAVIVRRGAGIALAYESGDAANATAALLTVSDYLEANRLMLSPRHELYAVRNSWGAEPVALIERNATMPLGMIGYGVNLNAWTVDASGNQLLWVGRRSMAKQTEPGKLDHIAAGGQPQGIGLLDNIIKEAGEEAAVPAMLARQSKPVGAVSGHYHNEICRRFIHYNFDLALPFDFVPRPLDGEVDAFFTWTPDEVIDALRDGYHFDLETAIAVIDWLIRHGHIHAENEPDFDALLSGLQADLFRL